MEIYRKPQVTTGRFPKRLCLCYLFTQQISNSPALPIFSPENEEKDACVSGLLRGLNGLRVDSAQEVRMMHEKEHAL